VARRKKAAAPTLDDIMARFQDAQQYWGLLHAEQQTDHTMFNLQQLVSVPQGYNVVRPATANSIISTAADHIAGDSPQVEVPEAGLSKDAQSRSERLEHGLQDALWRFQSGHVENPIRSLVLTGLWSGQMISQGPIFDGAEWGMIPEESKYTDTEAYKLAKDDYDDTKRTEWPFFWRVLDPRNVYPDPGTVGLQWVIVNYQRTAGSVQQQWPSWDMRLPGMSKSDKPLQSGRLIQFMEYWDEKYRAYIIGAGAPGGGAFTGTAAFTGTGSQQQFLDGPREHRYGKPPFQIRSTGYGEDAGLPHERFRSILYPARSLINQEIAAFSQLDAMMRRTAWSVVMTPIGSGFDSIEPGTVKEMEPEDIDKTKPFSEINASVIQSLMQELQFLSEQIQEATFPNVVQGVRAKGITSGYGQNSLVAQAKVKYGAAVVNLQALLADFLIDFARCVQYVVGEDVPVFGQTRWGVADSTLKRDDIGDLRKVLVTVNPKLPTDDANDIAMGQILLGLGAIDLDTFITDFAHYQFPGEMRVRIMRDKALMSPEIQRVISLAAALESGHIQYVMQAAQTIGMDPGQLLATLGFGVPTQQGQGGFGGQLGAQQQAPQQVGGQPQNTAPQMAVPQQSLMGGNMKPQPTPGGQSDIRNAVAPGISIGQ
jgi:hypothetical protein